MLNRREINHFLIWYHFLDIIRCVYVLKFYSNNVKLFKFCNNPDAFFEDSIWNVHTQAEAYELYFLYGTLGQIKHERD